MNRFTSWWKGIKYEKKEIDIATGFLIKDLPKKNNLKTKNDAIIDKAIEKYTHEQLDLYEEYKKEDQQNKNNIANYNPKVELKNFLAGYFLCCGTVEVPIKYIINIEIIAFGNEPYLKIKENYDMYRRSVYGTINYLNNISKEIRENTTQYTLYNNSEPNDRYCYYKTYEYKYIKESGKASNAKIQINLQGGSTHIMLCSRHEIEILYGKILDVWKTE